MLHYGSNPYSRYTDDENDLKSPINNYPKTTYPGASPDDDSVIGLRILCFEGKSVDRIERFWLIRIPVFFALIVNSLLTKIFEEPYASD